MHVHTGSVGSCELYADKITRANWNKNIYLNQTPHLQLNSFLLVSFQLHTQPVNVGCLLVEETDLKLYLKSCERYQVETRPSQLGWIKRCSHLQGYSSHLHRVSEFTSDEAVQLCHFSLKSRERKQVCCLVLQEVCFEISCEQVLGIYGGRSGVV